MESNSLSTEEVNDITESANSIRTATAELRSIPSPYTKIHDQINGALGKPGLEAIQSGLDGALVLSERPLDLRVPTTLTLIKKAVSEFGLKYLNVNRDTQQQDEALKLFQSQMTSLG
ncbi:MAG: hypothetical protein ABI599_09070 [Flavobacteriales bacterium]